MSSFRRVSAALAVVVATAAGALVSADAAGAPATPSEFKVVTRTASSLTYTWRDRATNETKYSFRFRRASETVWHGRVLPRNTRRYALTGLLPNTRYFAQVRACSATRCSPYSRLSYANTLPSGGAGGGGGGGGGGTGATIGGCPVFPASTAAASAASDDDLSAFNQDVSQAPTTPRPSQLSSTSLHPDFGGDGAYGIPYVVVDATTPLKTVDFIPWDGGEDAYPGESDPGPYRIPANAPVEGGNDRHVISVDVSSCKLYELYHARYNAGTGHWEALSGAIYDLNKASPLRPDGWTSADAAGLPILAGLVRYDEVAAGEVKHAIRVTFSATRNMFIHPATHEAGVNSANVASMGMRLRLKATYAVPSSWSTEAKVIAASMKRYGVIVADNGSNWFFTGAADPRWDDDALNDLKGLPGSEFEVVQSEDPPQASP